MVEAARGPQQDPREQAGRRRGHPEHEERDGVTEPAADLDVREGDVAQLQRIDEGEEHHRRHAGREEARPDDRADALGHGTRRVVEDGAHCSAPPVCAALPCGCDSDQT
jgi:hypothetical protein